MVTEPYVVDAQFDVKPGSAKAPAEQAKRPTIWFPLVMTLLAAWVVPEATLAMNDPMQQKVSIVMVAFTWPFYRALQWAFWALRSKVSEEDAERLAQRFPTRGRPPR